MVVSGKSDLDIIGSTEFVEIFGIKNIPAKIDTGADSSVIWASHIRVTKDGVLHFRLFDEGYPLYTGRAFKRTDFQAVVVRSTSGHAQIRYRTHITALVKGRRVKILFSLADRSKNNFPVLIGRRTIAGKFLVNVSEKNVLVPRKKTKTKIVQKRLKEDPYEFHQKYIKKLSANPDNIKLKRKA